MVPVRGGGNETFVQKYYSFIVRLFLAAFCKSPLDLCFHFPLSNSIEFWEKFNL